MDLKRYLACLIVLTVFHAGGALFRLQLGYEYIYKEEAKCNLESAGTIYVKAKVGFMPIRSGKASIEILLNVHNAILQHSNGKQVPADDMDFSKWFSIVIVPQHGDIEKVYHSSDEEPIILAMKKAFATMVFGKLHLHDDPMLKDVNHDVMSGKWNYSTYENGHEGLHKATYEAEPTAKGIRFTKTRTVHHRVKTAANNYTKVLEYDSHLGLVRKVSVEETFETGKAPKDFNPYENDRPELPTDSAINAEIPEMRSTGAGSAVILTANRLKQARVRPDTGLVEGMIHVSPDTSRKQENRTKAPDFDANFRGNLSCLDEKDKSDGYDTPGSIESVDCFAGLVRALKSLPDDDLISVTEEIFNKSKTFLQQLAGPSSASLHMVDALFDVGSNLSIRLLVEYGFASDPKTMKRMFAHFSITRKPSFKVFDDELERYCFHPESFPDQLQDEETHQQALLLLGSLIYRHNLNGQKESARRLVSKLEDMLGYHDPYDYNKIRSMLSESNAGHFDMHHVILLESLGNAGMERSYDHIISYVNVSTHEILRRSGLHALRSFNHDKAASVLYHAATQDESPVVRHESSLILRRHPRSAMFPSVQPKGSETGTLRPKEGPLTREDARLQRVRRGINDLFQPYTFALETPSVDWRKKLGNDALGASTGVILRNKLVLKLGIHASRAIIDIHDEVYSTLHLGIVGINFDLLRARICFYGEMAYKLNVLQEISFENQVTQIREFFDFFGNIVNAIKGGVEPFNRILSGKITIEGLFRDFIQALENLPRKVADLRRIAMNATELIGSMEDKELPSFIRPAKNLIHRISNLYNDIKTDVTDFYHNITDMTISLKRSAKSIFGSVKTINRSFKDFLDSPKQALSEVFKAMINIRVAITDVTVAVKKIKAACSFWKDTKPYWFDLKEKWTEITKDADVALDALKKGSQTWIDKNGKHDAIAKLTNKRTSAKKVKEKFLAKIRSTIDDLLHPIKYVLGDLTKPFLDGFFKVVNIIQQVKKAYQTLKAGYQTARQTMALLFGPRSHARFPRTIRQATTGPCASSGFYPSNIGYKSGAGIDLLIRAGDTVVAPYAGKIMLTKNPKEVKINVSDDSFADTSIILTNIQPNSSIHYPDDLDYSKLEVYAGQKIGVAARSACSNAQNHIHVVMKTSNGDFIDPTGFIEKRHIQLPTYTQRCNDFRLVLMNMVLVVGWAERGDTVVNETPDNKPAKPSGSGGPSDDNAPSGDDSKLYGTLHSGFGRRRRKHSLTKDLLKKLGFPKLGQYVTDTLKKFKLKNLKIGKIVSFLHSLRMNETIQQLVKVIKRIKELIDAKPCFNPHQLSDDQLRIEFADRSESTTGSRDQMIKRILISEPKCPFIQLKIPKSIYCVFDKHCLAVQCCINVNILMFNKAFRAFARIDPCDLKFVVGVNEWKYEYQLRDAYDTSEKTVPTGIKLSLFDLDLEIVIRYKIERTERVALGSLSVAACTENDFNSCDFELPLLDEAVLPLPICHPNGSLEWPDVNWNDYFSAEAIKKNLKESGKKFARFSLNKFLNLLGIQKEFLTNKGPCPRPESMPIKRLKKELRSRGLSNTGSRLDMNKRINDDDITCKINDQMFKLPTITNEVQKRFLHYKISQNCTRVDACVSSTIKSLDYTTYFRAYAELDVCKYILKFGIENYEHQIPIFVYRWGEPQQLYISKQIALKFTIDKDDKKKVFVVSLAIKICFDGDCPIDVDILDKKEIPQPICNKNFSLSVFKPGDGSIKKFLKELGGKITNGAFDYILSVFKLDTVFSDDPCSRSGATTQACPWTLSLDWLPKKTQKYIECRLTDNCLGAKCCMHLPFKLPFVNSTIHKYAEIAFSFDPCEFTVYVNFGSTNETKKLLDYKWGEEATFAFGEGTPEPVRFRNSITKRRTDVVLNLKVVVCLPIDGEAICIPDANGIQVFEDIAVPLCDTNSMATILKKFEASTLKDYLKKQGIGIGKKITGVGVEMILKQTGIENYLKDTQCDSSSHPYVPSVDGWKNGCKLSVFKLPRLPEFVRCHLDKDCKSLQCCVDVDFYQIFSRTFHFYVTLDTCDLVFRIGFERLSYNYTLLQYHWGKIEKFDILNMFRIIYSVDKDSQRNVFILNLHLCVSFDKNEECDFSINFMKDTEIPHVKCDLSAPLTNNVPADINSLKKYMSQLGRKATGMTLILPLKMLGLGPYIGVEGLCQDKEKPVKNPCTDARVNNMSFPTQSSSNQCGIQSHCNGIECCADIDLGFMQRRFRTFVTVDPHSYQLSIGFEKWNLTRYLFNYPWGKEQVKALGSAMSIRYSIGKSKAHYRINLRLEAAIADYTPVNFTILKDHMLPMPGFNDDITFTFPFSSWNDYKANIGTQASESVWDTSKRFLGLSDIIDDSACTHDLNQTINKERCPHLTMPTLHRSVQCTFDELCLGVTCCADFDFDVVRKSLKTWLIVDSAKKSILLGLGNRYYTKMLGDGFLAGDRMVFQISKFSNLLATIRKPKDAHFLLVDLTIQMRLHDNVAELDVLKEFQIPESLSDPDWKMGGSLAEFNFLKGNISEEILKRLNFDLAFFDPTLCSLLPTPSNNKATCSIKLPSWTNTGVRGVVKEDCLGIQVCIKFNLLSLEYDFKVLIEFLPREYKLRLAVEKWSVVVYIFQNFGIENTVYIKNGLGITYTLDVNTKGELVASFGIRICIDKHCADPIMLLDSAAIQMPYSLDNGTLIWPSADTSKLKEWLFNKALETSKDLLGVDPSFFRKRACIVPAKASCPYFTLPPLPPSARCELSRYCTGIECCLDVQMKITNSSFKAWALLDPCEFVFSFGFEKWVMNDTLFNYRWGEAVKKEIADTVKLEYNIGKSADNNKFELSVKFSISLEKYNISIPEIVLLDKAHIPIPICNISKKPQLVWQDPGSLVRQASAIALSRLGMDSKLLFASSCKPYSNASNNHQCPHSTLPSELPAGLSLRVMDICTGVEACLPLDLKVIKRSFKVWIMVDPCNFKFSLGFEKWMMNTTWSESLMGKELVEKIGRAVSLKYSVDKTADNRDFIFTLKVGLCLDGACTSDITIVDRAMMPIPLCDKDGTFKWPSLDDVSGVKSASELVQNRLGVEQGVLFGEDCKSPVGAKSTCPYIKLPTLTSGVNCRPTEYCTGVTCCTELDLKIVKGHFALTAAINPCEFTLSLSFEKAFYNMSLTGYTWGKRSTMTVGNVDMHYTIRMSRDNKEFFIDLELELCLDGRCAVTTILKNQTMPIPLCNGNPGNYSISWPAAQNYGSVIYNILGVGLHFFKTKECVQEISTSACSGVTLPSFAENHCILTSRCLGIQCCFDFDTHVSKIQMMFYFEIDQCKKELRFGLENKNYTVHLDAELYGSHKMAAIGSMLSVKYQLLNTGYTFKANLDLNWCWKNHITGNKTCGNFAFLKETSFRQLDSCPTNRRRRSVNNSSQRSTHNRYSGTTPFSGRGNDRNDIWSITKSLVKEGKSGNDVKQHFDDISQKKGHSDASYSEQRRHDSYRSQMKYVAERRGIGRFVRGDVKPENMFTIQGAEGMKSILGQVMNITGRLNEVFTPGEGLTNAGIKLLGAELANMTIGDISALLDMLDMQNLAAVVVCKLRKDFWKLFEAIYFDSIDAFTPGKLLEYLLDDLHLHATFRFPKRHLTFYHGSQFFLVGGLVPMVFDYGVDGYVGLEIRIGARGLKMFGYTIVTPVTGIEVYGELGVGFILYAKLRLSGAICDTSFPTIIGTHFSKFPLSVKVRVDYVLIPLILKLKALVTLEVKVLFIRVRIVLFSFLIWKYQAPSIRGNIIDEYRKENDDSGPIFESYVNSMTELPDAKFRIRFDFSGGKRKRRSAKSRTNQCQVHQLAGRDYTEPAFEISVKATDDKSQVYLYLDMGFVPGGTEIQKSTKLGGPSIVMTDVLRTAAGRNIYFRVRGQNSQGSNAYVDCSIPTYDLTPPVARVKTNFVITSNRHVIEGSYRAFDDSEISRETYALGFGKSNLDDQISPWKVFTSAVPVHSGPSGDNEHFFTSPAEGRLLVSVTKTISQVLNPNDCAGHCLKEVPHKCMSFNYHYGKTGACELLEGIESIENTLTKSDMFYYYERLGSGSTVSLSRKDLTLTHNNLHYINVETMNSLGYRSRKSSSGILTDFTLPEPGPIANQSKDELGFRACADLIPQDKQEWRGLCVGVDSREKNNRVIIDGEGSKTIFNGGSPLVDQRFTRSNRYIAGNWDGFHDKESGIRGYTLAVGETVCEEHIREHRDPHAHLNRESEWTHKETIEVDQQLKDGSYYLTIRALNRADYGGPLAVTVCHSTPYVIDNTAPILKSIRNIAYDDVTSLLSAYHNARDPESHIKAVYVCLGRTPRTCDIKKWFSLPIEQNFIQFTYQLPDGIQTWLKLKAYNHVDMFTEVVADSPIMVDRSPPLAGTVFDGEKVHVDQRYSKYNNTICASWLGFSDPQSGLTSFELSVGTAPFSVNVVNRHRIHSTHHSYCIDLVPFNGILTHNKKYFFTVTAWNGGIRKMSVNATSDGVIIDVTPPVNGEVVDGNLQGFVDVNISSRSSVVAGQVRGFHDPESGINDTEIRVDVAPSPTGQFETVHEYQSIYPTRDFRWGHFHLKHKNQVRTLVRATNGANNTVTAASDGFLIDLTPPKLDFVRVVDEMNPEKDMKYQTVDNTMSVSYGFHDAESGIDRYRVRLYESYENRQTLIFESAQLQGNQTIYNKNGLKIMNGAFIHTEVESQNTAVPGLNAVARSSDVKVDTTPPEMSYVLVGVNSGEMEEKHNDTVFQSVTNGILASWKASDGQSGVEDYQVCVGTSTETCDELSWRSMDESEDGYIGGLSLDQTESTGKYYYVRVRAKNSAGLMSEPITGSRIAVLKEDATGHLSDGPYGTDSIDHETIGRDIDVTLDGHTVTVQFDGFSSHLYGIQHVEWAIGSSQYGEDVQPFTSKGIILSEDDISLLGHPGSGIASAPVDLEPGKRYFASVQVTTYQGNVLEASSDGFVVDQTPPSIIITRLGLHDKQPADLTEGNAVYQQTDSMLSASWKYAEDVGNVAFAQFAVSSIPGNMDIHPLTNLGRIDVDSVSSIPDDNANSTVKPKRGCEANMLEIYAGNDVGLISSIVSASIFIDDTPPICGIVKCPTYAMEAAELPCSWSGFKDEESGIMSYEFGLGSTPGQVDVSSLEVLPAQTTKHKVSVSATPRRYFAFLRATNFLGLSCEVTSTAITVDNTSPIPGVIVETSDIFKVSYNHAERSKSDMRNRRYCKAKEGCQQIDATCQDSMDQVSVAWTHFEDPETAIVSYHLAVGTSPGGSQIKPFFPVPITANHFRITRLNLKGKEKIYVTIKAYNAAGMSSSATSGGIYLSYVAQGLEPPQPVSVWDGDKKMEDMDYQHEKVSMGRINAQWNFNGDPCPSSSYEWRIERGDGRVIQDYANSNGQSFGSYDGVETKDGEMYYVKVKSTNRLGQVYIRRSDGLTIRKDKLLPGRVNDGDMTGFDLNYSPSTNQVNANWQSFGMHDPVAVLSGNSGVKEEKTPTSNRQVVSYYEVAVGTDRRYSHTRRNIVPYTSVGLNLSVTFHHLNLNAKKGTYYTTVRAHSKSLAMVEVTSNGFKAGYNDGVEAGEITMSDTWSNSSHLFARWDDFSSDAGIMFYHAGVTNTTIPENYTCDKAMLKKDIFPIASLRNVGDNTMVELSGLVLSNHFNYFLYVIGTDGAGLCNWTHHQFLVDTTPPDEGEIKVGPYWHLGAAFTATKSQIPVEWKGYKDPQSGLTRFEISLWNGVKCDRNSSLVPYTNWIKLSANYSSYSLIQLDLKEMVPYFVKLRAYNRAGLFVETVSRPIFVDESTPTAGDVIDGNTFTADTVWQKSTSEVNGTFLHFATKSGTPCPDRQVDFTSGWTKYDGIGLGVQRGVRWGIKYSADAIRNESNGSISIHMTRVRAGYSYLKSGAIARDADMSNVTGGDYIVRIRAADGQGYATTSVLLLDGSDDMLQDYNWQDEPEWTGTQSLCTCCYITSLQKKCPCDCEQYRQAGMKPENGSHGTNAEQQQKINHSNKTTSDVVALKSAPTEFTTQRSCGFQLVAGTKPYAVLWCSSFNDTLKKLKAKRYLDYDPSADWHTYTIRIYVTDNDPVHSDWCIEVFETKRQLSLGLLCGIETFTQNTKLIFHLWNKDNFLSTSPDWSATARFDGVRLPASDKSLCRYGSVFRGGSSSIIAYEAGIGTKPMTTDVAPYKIVARPCIPCIHACDVFTCDKSCPRHQVMQIRFTLDALSLPVALVAAQQNNQTANITTSEINQANEKDDISPGSVVYFLTVKAVLGSGAYMTGSSNGFRIDTTTPVVDKDINVTYIDFEQGEYKPVNYQSANGTIKALWRCVDHESRIMDYQWAIGTKPGSMDIQNFTSVGRHPAGTRTGLEGLLHHNHIYYVSIICTNYAGSELKYKDKKGVKVLLEKPIAKDIRSTLPGTTRFNKPVRPKNARKAKNKETIGITWTKARDQNIRRYEFGIGTSACEEGKRWSDDVFPFTWVGLNEAGKIEIKDGAVYYNGTKLNDTCAFSRTNYEENRNKSICLFNMEIGRTIFFCMKLCNLADKCVLKESGSATFVEEGKSIVASSEDGKGITVTVTRSVSRKRAVDDIAEIKTPEDLEKGQTLVAGPLNRSDVQAAYGSDVSVDFRKYIQDPNATQFMTERALRGRIVAIDGSGFFVNWVGHIPAPGPLNITVPYLSHQMTNTTRPMLLHWDTGALWWMISSTTCKSHSRPQESFNEGKLKLSTLVCRTHSNYKANLNRRMKRTTDDGANFKKETHFIKAQVSTATKNSPPIVSAEPMLYVQEDTAILRHTLTARDPDGDTLVFAIDKNKPGPKGVAVINPGGKMEYEPCMDCTGVDTVYYTVTEVNMGGVTPLMTAGHISINVSNLNDAPEIFLSRKGIAIFSTDSTFHAVKVSVEENTGYNVAHTDLRLLVGAYDRDAYDILNITSPAPANGDLIVANLSRSTPYLPETCQDLKAYAFPCSGLSLPHSATMMSWVTATITYKPKLNFHGQDSFMLQAFDQAGFLSNELDVVVNVLQNPCNNSGICRGLQEDFNCTDQRRATVNFTNYYTCSCTGGWTGPFCNADRDDCINISCRHPLTCVDKLNGYDCKCPDGRPDCDQGDSSIIVIISLSVLSAVVVITIVVIVMWRFRIRKHRMGKHNVRDAKLSGDHAPIELTASSQLDQRRKETDRKGVQEDYPFSRHLPTLASGSNREPDDEDRADETSFQTADRTDSVTEITTTDMTEEGTYYRNPAFDPEALPTT